MVLGRAPDHALSVAVVDAGLEPATPTIGHRARPRSVAADAATQAAEERARVAPTRVQFDVF